MKKIVVFVFSFLFLPLLVVDAGAQSLGRPFVGSATKATTKPEPKAKKKSNWDLRGDISVDLRSFPETALFPEQEDADLSLSLRLEPEVAYVNRKKKQRFIFRPFLRVDGDDSNRTHQDIRELNWSVQGDSSRFLIGVNEVFWGVAESRHLVDVVNQKDQVEDIDEEDKLGQLMLNYAFDLGAGSFEVFYLPLFRERTFPDDDARLRGALPIESNPSYESSAKEWHQDVALRWSAPLDDFDLGLSSFWGTSREARFVPAVKADGRASLRPFYDIINQQGIDLQWTGDALLLKLEAISRSGQGDRFYAAVAGFERTYYQVFSSQADMGFLVEYLYDDRDEINAPATTLDNDIFVGLRYMKNDFRDTTFLLGSITDLEDTDVFIFFEGSRRLGQRLLLELESRWFVNTSADSPAFALRRDGFVTLRLAYFL